MLFEKPEKHKKNAGANADVRHVEHGPDAKIQEIDHVAKTQAVIKIAQSARDHERPTAFIPQNIPE